MAEVVGSSPTLRTNHHTLNPIRALGVVFVSQNFYNKQMKNICNPMKLWYNKMTIMTIMTKCL